MHIQGVKILYNTKVQSMLKKDSEIEGTVSLMVFPYSGPHVLIYITKHERRRFSIVQCKGLFCVQG
jgi:hypothetical protein